MIHALILAYTLLVGLVMCSQASAEPVDLQVYRVAQEGEVLLLTIAAALLDGVLPPPPACRPSDLKRGSLHVDI